MQMLSAFHVCIMFPGILHMPSVAGDFEDLPDIFFVLPLKLVCPLNQPENCNQPNYPQELTTKKHGEKLKNQTKNEEGDNKKKKRNKTAEFDYFSFDPAVAEKQAIMID